MKKATIKKRVNHGLLTVLLLCTLVGYAHATWSIIIIDPKTKAIGIAGASCTYSVYGIGAIAPGKGAIVVQAMSNNSARAKGLQMILADASPDEILAAIKDPEFDPEAQQYAVICANYLEHPVTYTGMKTTSDKGAFVAKGIAVQGNTLADQAELKAVLRAAIKAQKRALPIEEVLMLAMEAGAELGGDKRCGSRKAASAFLTVARPGDPADHPYLNLVIYGTNEKVNAVEALRNKFDQWKSIKDK
ncbi:DUF1028 domain-containing protein [Niabella soli]|uniref:DUF1028 domain-containing protein n=1 Tax=Niabella soli DSM 19437 TaxID=929713 RepID=W0EX63_9BACT|nr:DUF1028 domain-containing protein [Niabella soli]AHF15367.1 hypothetical protein NIASO_09810 [Niabella soli DSM 19437]